MSLLLLNNDCNLLIIICLDYKSILHLGQVSAYFNYLCNYAIIWQTKLVERIQRPIQSDDPKSLYRKSLRAGSVKLLVDRHGHSFANAGLPESVSSRRDIVKASAHYGYLEAPTCVVCITLNERCIVTQYQDFDCDTECDCDSDCSQCDCGCHVEPVTKDIGPAQDALVHFVDQDYWMVVTLYNKHIKVMHFYGNNLDEHVKLPVLKNKEVKSLLGLRLDLHPHEDDYYLYVVCMLEDNSVVSAQCSFPSCPVTLVNNVCNAFVFGAEEIAWTTEPNTKYFRLFNHFAEDAAEFLDIVVYIENRKMRYVKYGSQGTKSSINLDMDVGELLNVPSDFNHGDYLADRLVKSSGCTDNVDDACITNHGDIFILRDGVLLYNLNKNDEWHDPDTNVLWMRSSEIASTICYIVG